MIIFPSELPSAILRKTRVEEIYQKVTSDKNILSNLKLWLKSMNVYLLSALYFINNMSVVFSRVSFLLIPVKCYHVYILLSSQVN